MDGKWLTTQDFDPDDLAAVSQLGTNKDKQEQLSRQLYLANALRGHQLEKGQMAGDIYIPPNPVANALTMYDRIQGIKDARQGVKTQNDLNTQRQSGLDHFLKSWLQKTQPANTRGMDMSDMQNAFSGTDSQNPIPDLAQ